MSAGSCRLVVATIVAAGACSSSEAPPAPPPPPPPPAIDAGVIDGITEIGSNDPDRFLDPDPGRRIGQPLKAVRKGPQRAIDVMLRSTPTGAMAAVDGVQVGNTPAYWYGEADGREHEFTFVLPGHAVGRYRFVPIQSGTVHARLQPVSQDLTVDAGVDPVTQPLTQQPFTPAHPEPLAPIQSPLPPPTVVTPPPNDVEGPGAGSGSGSGSVAPPAVVQ